MPKREIPSKAEIDMITSDSLGVEEQAEISDLFESHIREIAPEDTGAGKESLQITGTDTGFSISMVDYMWYLNNGFKGFVMHGLAGKTIPIRTPFGLIFRKATEESIGRHQITNRDPVTGQITAGNRPLAWRHPGVEAKRYVQQGVKNALPQVTRLYARAVTVRLLKETIDDGSNS